ncbi:MAG: hypothetical protein R2824_10615 [Saprospiraceae bacterium]|nr:hypothetical protein [Lewinella sp.]
MKNRVFIYSGILLTIGLGIWSASSLEMQTDVSTYNLAPSRAIAHYESFIDSLGQDPGEYGIVILEKVTGWRTVGDFRVLQEISDFWEEQDQIGSVSSIVNLAYPRKGIFSSHSEPFLDINHPGRLEKRLKDYDLYQDVFQKFLSRDRKYTLIFLETSGPISLQSADKLAQRDYAAQGVEIHYLQYDLVQKELESYLQQDSILLGVLSLLFILAGFYFFTHSLRGLGLITLMVAFNVSVTFIAMYLYHIRFTMHMITIPCIITVLSFTDIMHILYHQRALRDDCKTDAALQQAIIAAVKTPLLLTSLTNIVGLCMFLLLSENIHLFNYALASTLGVVIAYLSSRFIVIPLMHKKRVYLRRTHFQQLYSAHRTGFQWLSRRKSGVLFSFLLVCGVVISLVLANFRIDHPDKDFSLVDTALTRGQKIMETEFFGNKQAEIFITTRHGTVWDETLLSQMERIEQQIKLHFTPLYINSPTLIVKRYHRYIADGRAKAFYIPKLLGPEYKQRLLQYKNNLGGMGIINGQADRARIVFGFADSDLQELREKYAELRQLLQEESNPGVNFELSGDQYLSDLATYSFSHKILVGFAVSLVFSSLIILLLLRSVRISLGLLLVNLFPIFSALGLIIILDIAITPLTLFLLSVLLGVCVDDSIYIVTQKRLRTEGIHILPIFITSLVLALGFLSLSFSSFSWLQPFGWVFLIGIALAYVLDVFLLTLLLDQGVYFGPESGFD